MTTEELAFYASQSPLSKVPTDVDLGALPTDLDEIRAAVQGALVHWGWAEAYSIPADQLRKDEQQLRSVEEVLRRLLEIRPAPLTQPRMPIDRVVGICRHFALLHVALLRHAGIPARVRCGFANYFDPTKWVDHFIAERWDGARWVRDDPQVDSFQARVIQPGFDPHDQPPGRFLDGAQAWVMTRSGEADPSIFGIFDMWGQAYVGGNLLLDFAGLNKVELLPWDSSWGLLQGPFVPPPENALPVLDSLAALTLDGAFADWRARWSEDDAVRVDADIISFIDGVPTPATLPT